MRKYFDIFLAALAVAGAAVVANRSTREAVSETGTDPQQQVPAPELVAGSNRTLVGTANQTLRTAVVKPPLMPRLAIRTATGLKDLVIAVAGRIKAHGTVMLAAGLSYYALLAMFPAAIAAMSIYGLVADPAVLEDQITELTSALPEDTAAFVGDQLTNIVSASSSTLGLTTTISILAALWSASAGTKALISGINYAYSQPETRKFFTMRAAALGATFGIIVFGLGAAAIVGFLPQILDAIGLARAAAILIEIGRFPFMIMFVVLGLGALYKLAPNRPWRLTRWISPGAVVAAVVWVLATVGLSVYVNNFGSFGETYGTLAGLIVLMLWFFVSGLAVLVGAEVNSELEQRYAEASG